MLQYTMARREWKPKQYTEYVRRRARRAAKRYQDGRRISAIARKMKVSRDTIYRWLYWLFII